MLTRSLPIARHPISLRSFSLSTLSSSSHNSLSESHALTDSSNGLLLEFPILRDATHTPFSDEGVKITTLPSGTTVVSKDSPEPITSLGVFVTGGVSTESFPGTSHLMRHMTFQRSYTRSPLSVNRNLEELTPRFSAIAARDFFLYSGQVDRQNLDTLYHYISDMRYPKPHEYIIRDITENIAAESSAALGDPLTSLVEDIHKEAYRDVGYGNSLYAPLHNIPKFLPKHVDSFSNSGALVVVGHGTDHETLLSIVGDGEERQAATTTAPSYKGGERRTPHAGNTNVAIVFKGPALSQRDQYAASLVLKGIAGGASTRSKEGVGRGVTGRLYQDLALQDPATTAASIFSRSYAHSGLFGGYAQSLPGNAESTTYHLAKSLSNLASNAPTDEELSKGKKQAKASLCSLSRAQSVEWMGSLAIAGANPDVGDLLHAIDNVSAQDVANVAKDIFKGTPTLVANGDIVGVPTREEIAKEFTQ